MPVPLIKIVNPNGRVGHVPATYPPLVAGQMRRAPSETRQPQAPRPAVEPERDPEAKPEPDTPPRNAPKQRWVDHAVKQGGLTEKKARQMTRDQLVAHFTSGSGADSGSSTSSAGGDNTSGDTAEEDTDAEDAV